MFFTVLPLVIFIWLYVRIIYPCRLSWIGAILAVVLALSCMKFYIYRLIGGSFFNPDIPQVILFGYEWIYSCVIILFLLVMARDMVLFVVWLVRKIFRRRNPFLGNARYWSCGLVSVSLVLGSFGMYEAMRLPDVRRIDVAVTDLPPALEGFSIAHLSDLHVCAVRDGKWMRSVVEIVASGNPDLVVLTGDMVDGAPEQYGVAFESFRDLHPPYGIYGCVGNHEYYSGFVGWLDEFKRYGIKMLLNNSVIIRVNRKNESASFVLAGITDIAAERFGYSMPNISEALRLDKKETTEGDMSKRPVILLAHRPAGAEYHAAAGVDIQLSGHTHGGHFVGMQYLVGRYNEGYVSGLYQIGEMTLLVSNGTGIWGGFLARLGVSPEIIILRLTRKR